MSWTISFASASPASSERSWQYVVRLVRPGRSRSPLPAPKGRSDRSASRSLRASATLGSSNLSGASGLRMRSLRIRGSRSRDRERTAPKPAPHLCPVPRPYQGNSLTALVEGRNRSNVQHQPRHAPPSAACFGQAPHLDVPGAFCSSLMPARCNQLANAQHEVQQKGIPSQPARNRLDTPVAPGCDDQHHRGAMRE